MKQQPEFFHFLDLSPEFRNTIYELAVIKTHAIRPYVSTLGKSTDHVTHVSTPSLLPVNRQIRSEALPVFYSRNIFTYFFPEYLAQWVPMLGPEGAHVFRLIESVDLLLGSYGYGEDRPATLTVKMSHLGKVLTVYSDQANRITDESFKKVQQDIRDLGEEVRLAHGRGHTQGFWTDHLALLAQRLWRMDGLYASRNWWPRDGKQEFVLEKLSL